LADQEIDVSPSLSPLLWPRLTTRLTKHPSRNNATRTFCCCF